MSGEARPLGSFERRFVPYYPWFAGFGVLCFVANLTLNQGAIRLIALMWVVIVPLWISRYRVYRATLRQR